MLVSKTSQKLKHKCRFVTPGSEFGMFPGFDSRVYNLQDPLDLQLLDFQVAQVVKALSPVLGKETESFPSDSGPHYR